jgi:hypothetical protein
VDTHDPAAGGPDGVDHFTDAHHVVTDAEDPARDGDAVECHDGHHVARRQRA